MANFVAHFAIYADDLDRAQKFYEGAFGWRFEPWGPPEYFKVHTGDAGDPGVTEGALSRRGAHGDPGHRAYRCTISVDSIQEAVAAVEAHGGKLRSDLFEIPGVGTVVEFEDPEGNVVCAMQYETADRRACAPAVAPDVAESPRLYRVVVPSDDIEGSTVFYRRLLEMEGERVSPGRHYFHCGGVILAVVDPRADGHDHDTRANADHVYLAVADLAPFHERAEALGALSAHAGAIEKRPWGETSFYMKDSYGNPLCFVEQTTLFTGRGGG